MVLEDAHGFAHHHYDAELAIGVVVGHDMRTPEKEIIGSPSETVVKFVIDDRGEGGSVDFA